MVERKEEAALFGPMKQTRRKNSFVDYFRYFIEDCSKEALMKIELCFIFKEQQKLIQQEYPGTRLTLLSFRDHLD